MRIDYRKIPSSRYIQLLTEEVDIRKYKKPIRVYWVAKGSSSEFMLLPKSKVPSTADVIFGPTRITRNCKIKVPLPAYTDYCVCYNKDAEISIILG